MAEAGGQRAEEISAEAVHADFPSRWYIPSSNSAYQKDLDFTIQQLNRFGVAATELTNLDSASNEWIYYYGWDRPKKYASRRLAPNLGYEIENKTHLAEFSQTWHGKQVKIPLGYSVVDTVWEEIPRD